MRPLHVIRWVLVPVAAIAAWGTGLLFGAILLDLATRLCPKSQMVSGLCGAPWWPYADAIVVSVSAAFAAALIVIACSLTAPTHRPRVALIVYGLGAAWAAFLAIAGAAYLALAAAGIAGWGAVRWIRKRG